jgi:PKD repeat protein
MSHRLTIERGVRALSKGTNVHVYLFCLLGAALALPSAASAQQSCTGTPNSGTLLSQDHCYQWHIYNWLETITLADVTIQNQSVSWDGYSTSQQQLGDLFLKTRGFPWQAPSFPIRGQAKWFVLNNGAGAGIEATGKVVGLGWGSDAAMWHWLDIPKSGGGQGNPYYQDPKVCRRALVATAVDMLMQHQEWEAEDVNNRSDFLGGQMNAWAYAYAECKYVLDSTTQRWGFEEGFAVMIDLMRQWGPVGVNANMDTRAVSAAAHVYMATNDASIKDRAIRLVRSLVFGCETCTLETYSGEAIWKEAGYVAEYNGPETTYNGVSLLHFLEAYSLTQDVPEWSFMEEPVLRMIEFKIYQYFKDPTTTEPFPVGYFDGPAGYAGRTGDSYVYDQRDRPWREVVAAALHPTEKALFRDLKAPQSGARGYVFGANDPAGWIDTAIQWWNGSPGGGFPCICTQDTSTPAAWSHDHWPTDYYYEPPNANWYAQMEQMVGANDPKVLTPFERSTSFSKVFDDEFWAYKNSDGTRQFGWFVEHVPRQWPYAAWTGGSLQTFWTKNSGIIIMSKHNKSGDDSRSYDIIDRWGAHHVWGRLTGGGSFSNATWNDNGKPVVDVSHLTGGTPYVTVRSGFQNNSGNGLDTTAALVATRFNAIANGIQITRTIKSNQSLQVTELWESLPVYLRDVEAESFMQETSIEYWDGSAWRAVGTSAVGTTKLRLGRNYGSGPQYVYVRFQEQRNVKLSSSAWVGTYQTSNALRTVHISLLQGSGAVPLPAASITYSITTTDGTGGTPANTAPAAQFGHAATGLSVQFTDQSTDSDGQIATRQWNFGNGSTSTAQNPQHTYAVAGTYTVTLTVTDDDGASSTTSKSVTVSSGQPANQPPVATFTATPTSGTAPLTVNFNASASSDPNGTALTYSWDFGDGSNATGVTASHTYTASGTYTAVLTVSDGQATDDAQRTIQVTSTGGGGGGLVSHWSLDESSGTVADDAVGSNNGTLSGGPIWRPTGGQIDGALDFDGADDRVTLGNMDVSGGSGLTIAFWMNAGTLTNNDARFISKASGTQEADHYWMVSTVNSSGLRFRLKTGGTTSTLATAAGQVQVGTWYHVAVTYDGSNMRIYKDGVQVATAGKTGTISTGAGVPVALGSQPQGGSGFDGLMDDVRIYNEALSAAEIQAIMNTEPGGGSTTQSIPLLQGWNLISSYVEPEQTAMSDVFSSITSSTVIVKNGDGEIFYPSHGINDIGGWDWQDGYAVYMTAPATLQLEGTQVLPDPMLLLQGWNWLGYPRNTAMAPDQALASILSHVVLLKNGQGEVYLPEHGIDQIGAMDPGMGYKLYIREEATLTYPANGAASKAAPALLAEEGAGMTPAIAASAHIIIEAAGLPDGEVITAWAGDRQVGSGAVNEGKALVLVHGDDPFTEDKIEGAEPEELIALKHKAAPLRLTSARNTLTETHVAEITYADDALWQVAVVPEGEVPLEFALGQNYPNPVNLETMIEYGLQEPAQVTLEIYNALGQRVRILVNEHQAAGAYRVPFQAGTLPSGIYFYRLQAGDFVETRLMTLVR